MTYVIGQPCVDIKDRACVDECPVRAIYPEDDLPAAWRNYIERNKAYYEKKGA